MPKNIAILCNSTSWGGLEMNVLRLAGWLAESAHKVWFLAPENSMAFKTAHEHQNLQVISFQSSFKYGNLWAAQKLKRFLRKNQIPNILSSHSKDINLMVLTKILMANHLNISYLQQMHLGIAKKDVFHTFFYKRVNHWIAPLSSIAEVTLRQTNVSEKQIRIIPLCIDLRRFLKAKERKEEARKLLNLSKQSFIIGTIGRLDAGKGQEYLIRAVAQLKEAGFEVEALFIGDETKGEEGEYFPFLRYLSKELAVEQQIHFRPFTEEAELGFAVLDIFAMTSHHETFGMVTIEAMATGLPVVGSEAGGTSELLEHEKTGLLFQTKNAEDLTQKLKKLIENPMLASALAQEAQKVAQEKYAHTFQTQEISNLMV